MYCFCNRLLEAAKNESVVRSQDVFTLVQYVSRNPNGKTMAWDWVTLNWDYLVNRLVHLTVERKSAFPLRITLVYMMSCLF